MNNQGEYARVVGTEESATNGLTGGASREPSENSRKNAHLDDLRR